MDVYVKEYGVVGGTDQDMGPLLRDLLANLQGQGATSNMGGTGGITLHFEPKEYHFYPEGATRRLYYISNTVSEKQMPDPIRTIGVLLENWHNLTLHGHGATFVYHGRMTEMVLDNCHGVTLNELHFDYAIPTVFETEVVGKGPFWVDLQVPDREYCGRGIWQREGWQGKSPRCVHIRKKDTRWKRVRSLFSLPSVVRDSRPVGDSRNVQGPTRKLVRIINPFSATVRQATVGDTFHFREDLRDQVGMFVRGSSGITLRGCNFFFTHGLGVLCQNSSDLFFDSVRWAPQEGRTISGFADFLHISSCRGQVTVTNCHFQGAHDDCINIHGTHLQVEQRGGQGANGQGVFDANTMVVRYMHPQTYGWAPARVGDTIALVAKKSLLPFWESRVVSISQKTPRTYAVTLCDKLPSWKGDVLMANISANPNVLIEGNVLSQVPTRGILITTSGKAVIRKNTFRHTYMSPILVANDGKSWYESGSVKDLTIEENSFESCATPTIAILPEIGRSTEPVHSNIRIQHNRCTSSQTGGGAGDVAGGNLGRKVSSSQDEQRGGHIVARGVCGLHIEDNRGFSTQLDRCKESDL